MTTGQNDFTAAHYAPRAGAYVTSTVHGSGADLDQIETIVRDHPAARVLDLGCGGGHVSYRAAPHVAEVVACDVTAAMLDAVTRIAADRGLTNISVKQAAAESLPFEDAVFDFVLCRFTAHHWSDVEAGLREARRVLKPDGRAVFIDIVAPEDPSLDTHLQTVELLRDLSHVRDYRISEWLAALTRARFALEAVTERTLRMEFASWIARTRTSDLNAAAIRSLQSTASERTRSHFAVGADGSFDIRSATFVLHAAA